MSYKKIALGVNTFHTNLNRFKLANASYEKLSQRADVDVFDIQQPGVVGKFKTIDKLNRTCRDVVQGSTKTLPFVNDLFNILCEEDYDYFIITNADVMISPRLIKHILEEDITALPCSRLDVQPVSNITDSMIPVRWEIGGFDTFCFKTEWYRNHSWLFEDFIQGRPWYDHHYASLMKVFGNNDIIANKNPAMCLHEHHGWDSCVEGNPEYEFNLKQFRNSPFKKYGYVWDNYFADILKPGRQPWMRFTTEIPDESRVERDYFSKEIILLQDKIELERKKYNP